MSHLESHCFLNACCREKAAEIARAREAEAEAELDEWAGMIEIEDEGDGAGDVRVCWGLCSFLVCGCWLVVVMLHVHRHLFAGWGSGCC